MGNRESKRRGKEFKEIPENAAKFLAAIFEIGGSMSMGEGKTTVRNARGEPREYTWISSEISFHDNSEEKIKVLQSIYGGSARKEKGRNSWKWTAAGGLALYLLNAIQPYAPKSS